MLTPVRYRDIAAAQRLITRKERSAEYCRLADRARQYADKHNDAEQHRIADQLDARSIAERAEQES